MISPAVNLWLKEKWYLIVGALIALALLAWCILRKKEDKVLVDKVGEALQKKLADVRVEAALEIGRAQGREAEVKEEVKQITEMPAETREERLKQLQALSDLVNRTRRRK